MLHLLKCHFPIQPIEENMEISLLRNEYRR